MSDHLKTGAGVGLAVFVGLAIAVYPVQSGTIGGTALGLLVLSPLPLFVSGAVAGVRSVSGGSGSKRTAVGEGAIAGALVSVLPAVIAARFGYGLAAIGDNLVGAVGVLVTGFVLGILCVGGVLGGIGGWLSTLLVTGERPA
jgi:hypothetical protein